MRKIFQRFKVRETLVMISYKIAHLSFTLLPFLPINQTILNLSIWNSSLIDNFK